MAVQRILDKRDYDTEYWAARDDPATKALADMIAEGVAAKGQQTSLWYFVAIALVFFLGMAIGAVLSR